MIAVKMIDKIKKYRFVSLFALASLTFVAGGFFWTLDALQGAASGLLILHFNDMAGIMRMPHGRTGVRAVIVEGGNICGARILRRHLMECPEYLKDLRRLGSADIGEMLVMVAGNKEIMRPNRRAYMVDAMPERHGTYRAAFYGGIFVRNHCDLPFFFFGIYKIWRPIPLFF